MSMNESQVTVREATLDDVDVLVTFQLARGEETDSYARVTTGKGPDPALLRAGIAAVFRSAERGFYIIAEVEGRSVAMLLVTYEWNEVRNATFWWIQSVYVDATWRRKGVYRTMHDYIFGAARARHEVCGVRLYVERTNRIAQQTYSSLGMAKSHYDMYEVDFVLE